MSSCDLVRLQARSAHEGEAIDHESDESTRISHSYSCRFVRFVVPSAQQTNSDTKVNRP